MVIANEIWFGKGIAGGCEFTRVEDHTSDVRFCEWVDVRFCQWFDAEAEFISQSTYWRDADAQREHGINDGEIAEPQRLDPNTA